MFLHRRVGAHAVKQFVLLAVFFDDLAAALRVAGQHTTEHHKVCSST